MRPLSGIYAFTAGADLRVDLFRGLQYGSSQATENMRRAFATSRPAPSASIAIAGRVKRLGGARAVLPWLGTIVFAFLLFRLLFGHLYIMRGSCECGRTEQWYEFNDRPYTIGIRLSARALAAGNAQHSHFYQEPVRAERY